jgi:hypothetical protein
MWFAALASLSGAAIQAAATAEGLTWDFAPCAGYGLAAWWLGLAIHAFIDSAKAR